MKVFAIDEIFNSIQFEGRNGGMFARFVRFLGCPLKCPFCDTLQDITKVNLFSVETLTEEIVKELREDTLIVLTGGEPTAQPIADLVVELRRQGLTSELNPIAVETNGLFLQEIDLLSALGVWITLSPKHWDLDTLIKDGDESDESEINKELWKNLQQGETYYTDYDYSLIDEVKLVLGATSPELLAWYIEQAEQHGLPLSVQPQWQVQEDGENAGIHLMTNWVECYELVQQHPIVRLSVQTQKLVGLK